MKPFKTFILEELSDKNKEILLSLVDDSNFNDLLSVINKHLKLKKEDENYPLVNSDSFYKEHGLHELKWAKRSSAQNEFKKLFQENDKTIVLNEIIKNNGLISLFDDNDYKKLNPSGNLFKDYCNITINGEEYDFSDEAKEISLWTNSRSSAAGPCENLLKFLLHEGGTGKSGDVAINGTESMEVKATTLSKGGLSGGHPIGRGKKYNVLGSWAIYYFLDKFLFNESDVTPKTAAKRTYFQNNNGFNGFKEKLNQLVDDKLVTKEQLAECLVDAVLLQYSFIPVKFVENIDIKDKNFNYIEIVNENTFDNRDIAVKEINKCLKKLTFNNVTLENFTNLIGVIQLYIYSQIEQFEYIFFVKILKDDTKRYADENGDYVYFLNTENTTNDDYFYINNFENILKYIKFGTLYSATDNDGRTGKIYLL